MIINNGEGSRLAQLTSTWYAAVALPSGYGALLTAGTSKGSGHAHSPERAGAGPGAPFADDGSKRPGRKVLLEPSSCARALAGASQVAWRQPGLPLLGARGCALYRGRAIVAIPLLIIQISKHQSSDSPLSPLLHCPQLRNAGCFKARVSPP
jgi:hypothetical protein